MATIHVFIVCLRWNMQLLEILPLWLGSLPPVNTPKGYTLLIIHLKTPQHSSYDQFVCYCIGIGEACAKKVAKQIGSALDWIHLKNLCHLDVRLDNILVFKSDFSVVKLCDFGSVRAQVKRQ